MAAASLFLWGEASVHAVCRDTELKRFYHHKLVQKGLGKARTAVARKLGIRSCCGIRLIITSSVVADRSSRQAVKPVRECLADEWSCIAVTGVLNGLPASLNRREFE
jgi:hypothetical protein